MSGISEMEALAARQVKNVDVDVDIDILECRQCKPAGPAFDAIRPGDSLEGRVRLTSRKPLDILKSEVYLQGTQSTSTTNSDHERHVVSKNLVDISCISQDITSEVQAGKHAYNLPFFFIIPDGTELHDDGCSTSCRALPPSFHVQNSYFHSWSPTPFPDISVTYTLRAVVTYGPRATSTAVPTTVVVARPLLLLPYVEIPPPVNVDSFPGEFTLHTNRPLWKHIMGRRLGSITVATGEPPPLAYSPSAPTDASIDCILDITVEGDASVLQQLRQITLEVEPLIHAKTYYSSRKLPCMPNKGLLNEKPYLHLHNDTARLETQKFRDFQWRLVLPGEDSHNLSQSANGNAPPTYEQITAQSSQQLSRRATTIDKIPTHRSLAAELGGASDTSTWQTSIRISMLAPGRLQPSFCSDLIARSYSLVLQVHVRGAYAKRLNLEVPLQVAYPREFSSDSLDSESGRRESLVDEGSDGCLGPASLLSLECALPTYTERSR